MSVRLRTQKNHGNVRYVLDWDDQRGKRHQKFFPSSEERAQYMDQHGLVQNAGQGATIDEILGTWLRETKPDRQENSQQTTKYRAKRVLKVLTELGITRISQITPGTFAQIVDAFEKEGLAYPTIHDYATCYKAAMSWAVRKGLLSKDDLGECKLREPHQNRVRYLSKDEINTLLEYAPQSQHPWMLLPVALGIYQGLRRAEVCRLKGEDLDYGQGTLTVGKSKNKKVRTIQLHPNIETYLPSDVRNDEHVCKNQSGNRIRGDWLTHAFTDIRNELATKQGDQWEDVSFHTLRHTCASQMALSGNFTLNEMALFLGHSNIETTRKYVHLMPGQVTPNW